MKASDRLIILAAVSLPWTQLATGQITPNGSLDVDGVNNEVRVTAFGTDGGGAMVDADWTVQLIGPPTVSPGGIRADIYLGSNDATNRAAASGGTLQNPDGSTVIPNINWTHPGAEGTRGNGYPDTDPAVDNGADPTNNLFALAVPGQFGANQDNYGVELSGQIFIPSDTSRGNRESVRFHDGVDDFCFLEIDDTELINHNAWTGHEGTQNNGGTQATLDVSHMKYDDGEWVAFRMVSWEGGGGDTCNLVWDALDISGADADTGATDTSTGSFNPGNLPDGPQVAYTNGLSDMIPSVNLRTAQPSVEGEESDTGQPADFLTGLSVGPDTVEARLIVDGVLIATVGIDRDGDCMPDTYEIANGLDPDDPADGLLDPDNDNLDNAHEFKRGTKIDDEDSDDDGLLDSVEDGSGNYQSATDTGTDPLNPDTDGDGLLDGVETNNGPSSFVDADDTGSDPHLVDTDGDGFSDGSEVSQNTDPTDPNDFPGGVQVLFLGGQPGPTQGADPAVMQFLQDRYGAANVTYMQSSAAASGDELDFGLLVLSSTPGSGTMRNKFQNSPVPIFNWEEALTRNAGGEFAVTDGRTKETAIHSITIDIDHPITQGFNVGQVVEMTNASAEFWWSTGAQAPGAISLASDHDTPSNGFLTIVEADDELLNGSPAPARRVMFGITDATFNFFTDDGKTLFGQALDWAAGVLAPAEPIRVVDIALDTSNPAAPEVTLTWTSKVGKTYTVFANTELNPLDQWGDLDDAIIGQEGTTSESFTIPAGERVFFFKVQENE